MYILIIVKRMIFERDSLQRLRSNMPAGTAIVDRVPSTGNIIFSSIFFQFSFNFLWFSFVLSPATPSIGCALMKPSLPWPS